MINYLDGICVPVQHFQPTTFQIFQLSEGDVSPTKLKLNNVPASGNRPQQERLWWCKATKEQTRAGVRQPCGEDEKTWRGILNSCYRPADKRSPGSSWDFVSVHHDCHQTNIRKNNWFRNWKIYKTNKLNVISVYFCFLF